MRASKLELLYFILFFAVGLSLSGIAFLENNLLKSVLNSFAGFLSLLAAMAVLWRWFVFRLELQSNGLAVRQLFWNSSQFRPEVLTFFLPYSDMCLIFYRSEQKHPQYGIVLKNNGENQLPELMREFDSFNTGSADQEIVLEGVGNSRVFSTHLLDEKQIKLLTADLVLRSPELKLEDELKKLLGLQKGVSKVRRNYNLGLVLALIPVVVMAIVLLIMKYLYES